MLCQSSALPDPRVALRTEGVDRNANIAYKITKKGGVALRTEGVDRNQDSARRQAIFV